MSEKLAVIGAGNMTEAIVRGMLGKGLFRPDQLIAADPSTDRRELFTKQLGVQTVTDAAEAVRGATVVLLSVKPQQMADVLKSVAGSLGGNELIVSIAAGIRTAFIETHLGDAHAWRTVRVMPNTPMLLGEGMSAIALGKNATADDLVKVRTIFESAGSVIDVEEDQMNAVTAVSGSGPAYFYFLVEHMIRAGEALGLSHEQAETLARKTAFGAAKMLATSTDSPQELRRKVTSPGGTTHAAITHMEAQQLPQTIVDAIKAADRRGKELGG